MSWWSWASIGYIGLNVLLVASLAAVCSVIRMRSRRQSRRLVRGAERFLAEVALASTPL